MKHLLNTLYNNASNRYLALDGENVVILEKENEIARIPLHNLESIITFGYTGVSPALMGVCVERNINLSFMTSHGRFLARITGELNGNVTLRKEQYRISEDIDASLQISKNFITAKVYNTKWVIERIKRDNAMRINVQQFEEKSKYLANSLREIRICNDMDRLRGYEGEAASVYFSILNDMILQQKKDFIFQGRNKRPALDSVNAMLSFAYSLLAGMCASALEAVGFDSYVGFMHTDHPGRISLALDLMEEFRCIMADRFVLTMINKKMIHAEGFIQKENGAVIMDDDTRKTFLSAWQVKKQELITHPFLGEKVEWGMVPYTQALLLARYVRGDIDEYPPFFWK